MISQEEKLQLMRHGGAVAELEEPMWCPYCLAMQPHKLFIDDLGIIEWCQHCLRIHLYEMREVGGALKLVPILDH